MPLCCCAARLALPLRHYCSVVLSVLHRKTKRTEAAPLEGIELGVVCHTEGVEVGGAAGVQEQSPSMLCSLRSDRQSRKTCDRL